MLEFSSINPFNGEAFAHYESFDLGQLDSTLASMQRTQENWQQESLQSRATALKKIAATLREHQEALAELATLEMGKTLASSRAEVEKCAWVCDYYADNGPVFLQDKPVATSYSKSFISAQPLGVLLAIMPWNFPYW
jgi:succinate-semialdehyde dehydrogenase/glutarate-semialdehyde dehydrogenase